jgi:hypothetical protein
MVEHLFIAFLAWNFIASLRFLWSLEETTVGIQPTGIDWLILGPFFLSALIIAKIRGTN